MELLSSHQNIPKLSLKEILEDNTALSYFIGMIAKILLLYINSLKKSIGRTKISEISKDYAMLLL